MTAITDRCVQKIPNSNVLASFSHFYFILGPRISHTARGNGHGRRGVFHSVAALHINYISDALMDTLKGVIHNFSVDKIVQVNNQD